MDDVFSRKPPDSYSEEDLKRILGKAIEIDADLSDRISLEMLEGIAQDLEISKEALRRALDEMNDVAHPRPGILRRVLTGLSRMSAAVPILGFGLGVMTRLVRPLVDFPGWVHLDMLTALTVIVGVTLYLALKKRTKTSQITFQLHNLTIWIAFTVGYSLVHGSVWDDLIFLSLIWWLAGAVLGGGISAYRNRGGSEVGPADLPGLLDVDEHDGESPRRIIVRKDDQGLLRLDIRPAQG